MTYAAILIHNRRLMDTDSDDDLRSACDAMMHVVLQSPRDTATAAGVGVGVGIAQQPATVTNLYASPEYVISGCMRGIASPVLTATGFVNGKGQFSTPHRIYTPQPITKNLSQAITSATPTDVPN